ncbi:hypothetical protein ACJ72_07090 [Emergomyces africanus]|uniref:FAD-binding domain-containing protein n=1 Tax=Emergomyces africanus TaxID=1955775 RepID=A0A1B7NPQ0_9EURO|nr:hypothetical protein ACJ72_07090 [Emergomyces africanus]
MALPRWISSAPLRFNAWSVPARSRNRAYRSCLAQGPGRNSMIDETRAEDGKRPTSIVHRAAFLRELLKDVPPERLHASKRLERVDKGEGNGPITIHFTDGTTRECGILVGADGIHSTVRKIILGEDDPAVSPRNAG